MSRRTPVYSVDLETDRHGLLCDWAAMTSQPEFESDLIWRLNFGRDRRMSRTRTDKARNMHNESCDSQDSV
jgi:hypothetical protein